MHRLLMTVGDISMNKAVLPEQVGRLAATKTLIVDELGMPIAFQVVNHFLQIPVQRSPRIQILLVFE